VAGMNLHLEDLLSPHLPLDPQLSPDGTRIAFVMSDIGKIDKDHNLRHSVHMLDLQTGEERLFAGTETTATHSPRWSPDGNWLALISNRAKDDEYQLYLLDTRGGEAQALTDLRGTVHHPCWLADGKTIAFLYNGTLDREKPKEPDPVVVDADPHPTRVWAIHLQTREIRAVTPDNLHIFEYVLSPDSDRLAIVAAAHPNPSESWYHAQLHVTDRTSGETRQIGTMAHQIGGPSWSPDGTQIALISGIMSDQGAIGGEVYVIDVASGDRRCVTPGIDHTPTWIEWRAEGILYGARRLNGTLLGWIDVSTYTTREIWAGPMQTLGGSGLQKVSTTCTGQAFAALKASFSERCRAAN